MILFPKYGNNKNHSSHKNEERKILKMKRLKKLGGIIAFISILGVSFFGCDNGSTGNSNGKKIGYMVDYEEYSLFYNSSNVLHFLFAQNNDQIDYNDYLEIITNLTSDDIIFTPNNISDIISCHYSSSDGW